MEKWRRIVAAANAATNSKFNSAKAAIGDAMPA
jgi:hypothetical protein